MTRTTKADGHSIGVPLPDLHGDGEKPREIVYARYTYDGSKSEGERVIVTTRGHVPWTRNIARFVQDRIDRKGLFIPRRMRLHNRSKDPKPDRRLNVYVGDPCWVVIELDHNIPWHFESGQPGITVEPGHDDDNCDLVHVMPDGTHVRRAAPAQGTCRLLFFRVQRRCGYEHQRLYCHIIHRNKRLEDPDQVDPDIPNDGGKFPFPLHGKPCPEDDA
ncbi:MAG: hypothetical protein QME55_00005 [Brevundimonas sp.]|uniref:hypothetical protein n=1 Tax=Brevundimonas sp. TaxID=1871086 RepID=UPI002625605C|nr:hypothetical protein [Brevundimonas sp.]MDI6623085.1 hypothetical protein [Brevundimonas sp.]